MNVLYFAWLRQRTGTGQEEVALPDGVATVGEFVEWLKARGPGYAKAFEEPKVVRAAVNQEYVKFDHPLSENDEIAFFPPVTGG